MLPNAISNIDSFNKLETVKTALTRIIFTRSLLIK